MDESIFKAYDIRGTYPEQINEQTVYSIARSFAIFIKEFYKTENPKIIVGRDIRVSSKSLSQAVINGLLEEDSRVVDIGLCTTPLSYFANAELEADGSIMITASHNPKEYNGLKLSLREAQAIAEINGIEKIKEIALSHNFSPFEKNSLAESEDQGENITNRYLDFLKAEARGIDFSKLKVAIDTGNGMIGPIWEKMAKELGINYEGFFLQPNGEFPNHPANPLDKEAQQSFTQSMSSNSFDIGFIFDGDGDRIMVFDSLGQPVRNDFLLGILAQYSLPNLENKKVVIDARLSRGAEEQIEKNGISLIKSEVGYPNVRRHMRAEEAFFGGELSGHFFWKDFYYAESALLTSLRVLKVLLSSNKTISELVQPFKTYFNSGEINFKVLNKEKKLKEIEEHYQDGEISHLDGVTVNYKDWWFNLRPSNTEPLLRLVIETRTQKALDSKKQELSNLIQEQS